MNQGLVFVPGTGLGVEHTSGSKSTAPSTNRAHSLTEEVSTNLPRRDTTDRVGMVLGWGRMWRVQGSAGLFLKAVVLALRPENTHRCYSGKGMWRQGLWKESTGD